MRHYGYRDAWREAGGIGVADVAGALALLALVVAWLVALYAGAPA